MKVTFPHMGTLHVLLKALLESLDVDVVVPPSTSHRTVELGVKHAPEFACLPLKVNIGNFLEGFAAGADTVVMGGGVGPCRFGYYAEVQRQILRDLGYDVELIVLEPPQGHLKELYEKLRRLTGGKSLAQIYRAMRFTWDKLAAIESVEAKLHVIRPREAKRGETSAAYASALSRLDAAQTHAALALARQESLAEMAEIAHNPAAPSLRIGVVGEVYMVLEPFLNFEVERKLEEMGVSVARSIYLTDWIRSNLLLDAIHIRNDRNIHAAAKPYLNHFVGGHGLETVAHSILYAKDGFDGVVQVAPLTCMPEIVAESILPKISQDFAFPVLTLFLDEHSGEAGTLTRLEAFVDLLAQKKEVREENNVRRVFGA